MEREREAELKAQFPELAAEEEAAAKKKKTSSKKSAIKVPHAKVESVTVANNAVSKAFELSINAKAALAEAQADPETRSNVLKAALASVDQAEEAHLAAKAAVKTAEKKLEQVYGGEGGRGGVYSCAVRPQRESQSKGPARPQARNPKLQRAAENARFTSKSSKNIARTIGHEDLKATKVNAPRKAVLKELEKEPTPEGLALTKAASTWPGLATIKSLLRIA